MSTTTTSTHPFASCPTCGASPTATTATDNLHGFVTLPSLRDAVDLWTASEQGRKALKGVTGDQGRLERLSALTDRLKVYEWKSSGLVYDEQAPLEWDRAMGNWDQTKIRDREIGSFHEPMFRLFETVHLLEQLSQESAQSEHLEQLRQDVERSWKERSDAVDQALLARLDGQSDQEREDKGMEKLLTSNDEAVIFRHEERAKGLATALETYYRSVMSQISAR